MPTHIDLTSPSYPMQQLRAWESCWRGLGARRGESIYDAAARARYHGHERARASEILLAQPEPETPEGRWARVFAAAEVLSVRLLR